jgi:hypothetical protein
MGSMAVSTTADTATAMGRHPGQRTGRVPAGAAEAVPAKAGGWFTRDGSTTPWPTRWLLAVDGVVFDGYRSGWLQSLVAHTAVLLLLALVVVRPDQPQQAALSLDFSAQPAEEQPNDAPEVLLPLPEVEELLPLEEALAEPLPEADMVAGEPEIAEIELTAFAATDMPSLAVEDVMQQIGPPAAVELATSVASPARRGSARGDGIGGAGGMGMAGGIGGELGRRLQAAGAGTGDVQISISWEGLDDIDVHVTVEPFGRGFPSTINWMQRVGAGGGHLDVDANAGSWLTRTPVENVFWGKGAAPFGRYTVAVHHFRRRSSDARTPVEVAVLVDGKVERFHPVIAAGSPPVVVTRFVRTPTGLERAVSAY